MDPAISIDNLHPTQLTLGMAEVRRRAQATTKLAPGDLKALLLNKSIPHVLGPQGRIYMVDHHHLCRAMLEIGQERVILGKQLVDLSALDQKGFWLEMEARRLCWPIDVNGNRRPYSKIPAHVRDLTDNPWRTLARSVRGQAYTNEDTPFQEFKWGDYYRSFMSRRLLECDVVLATELAMKLSQIDEAQDLPGYIARV
ncbi:MAG: ParB-like protein [Xanthobacter sp.]